MENLNDLEAGDIVFCVNEDDDDYEGLIYMATCLDYVIVCTEYVGRYFVDQLYLMSQEVGTLEIYIFPEDKVFDTEDKAEKYIKALSEEE